MMLIVYEALSQLVHLFFDGPPIIELGLLVCPHRDEVNGMLKIPHIDLARFILLTIEDVSVLPMRLAYLESERI